MKLFYRQPAVRWVEALPQGNGRQGIMTFGGIKEERIGLNEDTLWSGHPRDTVIPGSYAHIRKAQELILQGKVQEAEEEIRVHVLGEFTESYEPLGDLLLSFPLLRENKTENYRRELDLENGTAVTSFTQDGVDYTRTTFVSYPRQMACLRMTASRPVLSARIRMTSPLRCRTMTEGCEIRMDVRCPSRALPGYYDTSSEAISYDDAPERQGISAAAFLSLMTDGQTGADGECLQVSGADVLELRFACRSNFEAFDKYPGLSQRNPAALAMTDLKAAEELSWDALLAEHTADFEALMSRQTIDVGGESREDLPTDERLRRYAAGEEDVSLPVLLYRFGRYLLVSGSRQGAQALNLQGIWNDRMQPPWSSNYTVNINTEMNYWPAEICNLSETHEPLFDLLDRLHVTGGHAAEKTFHARGATVSHNTDLWGLATPVGMHQPGSVVYGWWPLGFAWLSGHVSEHYIYTGDREFLEERALPVLRDAALFLIDTVTEDEQGFLTFRPATSPENAYLLDGQVHAAARSATMTDAIIRETLESYLKALEILGLQETDAEAARRVLAHLPPTRTGPDGRLLEWDEAYEEREPQHRHLSLLTGVFPGHLITEDSPEEIRKAVYAVLERRGDEGTGWSLGWKVNLWARLRDGDHALRLLRRQLKPVEPDGNENYHAGGTYLNLFCAHPPFQIDGNFAAASGVPRLLIDSAPDEVTLLPALPAVWRDVTARGLRGANGYTADLTVKDGKMVYLRLVSGCERTTVIRRGEKRITLSLRPGEEIINPAELM